MALPKKPPMSVVRKGRGTEDSNKFSRRHAKFIKLTRGRIGASFFGAPVGILGAIGRKSGELREVPMIYGVDGDSWIVIASNGGHERNPPWYLNLEANPDVTWTLKGADHAVVASTVDDGDERDRLWTMMNGVYPGYDDYQADCERQIPVVRLTKR